MAYDENLAQRIRSHLTGVPGLVEKKMFGGVGFMINGNMACGVNGSDLILRVDSDRYEQIISQPHVRIFDMTGRPMKGWVLVAPGGTSSEEALKSWIQQGVSFALTLPPK
jgi:TfoX/Sxy family transcriptional regulator of competence genes